MISAVLAEIDARVKSILALNSSITSTYGQIADNLAAEQASIESDRYIESYSVLRAFVRNVMHYANAAEQQVPKSLLIDTSKLTTQGR